MWLGSGLLKSEVCCETMGNVQTMPKREEKDTKSFLWLGSLTTVPFPSLWDNVH